jgi:predicted alpha/beta-fold hydrolase
VDSFRPHPILRGGHLQTLAATLITEPATSLAPELHRVDLGDGDWIVLHDDQPAGWRSGDPSLILVHGLGGCHAAGYMIRTATRFHAAGTRVFRVDMRGSGSARHPASQLNHAGRSDDILAALRVVDRLTGQGPIGMVGVSLGGNQLLKMLGEIDSESGQVEPCINRLWGAVAVAPPVDLIRCSENMQRAMMQPYNRYFITRLLKNIPPGVTQHPVFEEFKRQRPPRTLLELDDRITAPVSGFRDAEEYYRRSSACNQLARISIPTLVIAAANDPIVPVDMFHRQSWAPDAQIEITTCGGHVGFVSLRKHRHWLERRIEKWFNSTRGHQDSIMGDRLPK